jgi:hypothetical protein
MSDAKQVRRVWFGLAAVLLLVTLLSVTFIIYRINSEKFYIFDHPPNPITSFVYQTNTKVKQYIDGTDTAKAWTKTPTSTVTPG